MAKKPLIRWNFRISLSIFVFLLLLGACLLTTGIFILLYQIPYINHLMGPQQWYFFVPFMFAIVVSVIFAYLFAKRWLKAISSLSHAAEQVSKGNFQIHIPEEGHWGEVRDMISSFNHMVSELAGIELFRKDFINYFSHEFKTPIVSIRGFAKQLEDTTLPPDKRAEYTQIIIEECDRLSRLATNILLLSQFENQTIISSPVSFSLDEQIRRCILLLEKGWATKELELDIDLEELSYTSDPEMLSLVWTNLLSNAIKYTPKQGKISIVCKRVGQSICVSITDNGIGMSEEVQSHIFEKFYQADASHKSEGSGLGLAMVKRIIDLCEGSIAVKSQENEGSTFTVILPKE